MPRSIYIRLSPYELVLLGKMAAEQRRSPQEQAAYMLGWELRRWAEQLEAEQSLSAPEEDAA